MPSLLATPARPLEEIALPASRLGGRTGRPDCNARRRPGAATTFARAFHALGRSYHDLLRLRAGDLSAAPDAVLYPRGTEEVLAVLCYASEHGIAVVPYGGGTSVVGGVTAEADGRSKAVGHARSVRHGPADRCRSRLAARPPPKPASTARRWRRRWQAKGVTLGHYPQSFEFSTLGGWIAIAAPARTPRLYGSAEDWLVSAKLATPRGLLTTEDFPASAAGPRLTDLVLGSEGVFGVVTEATFRMRPQPAAASYSGYLFRDFASGVAAIREAVQDGLAGRDAAPVRCRGDAFLPRLWRARKTRGLSAWR